MNESSKAERTRQFIIETTAGIFNKKGYSGTSLSDLTEATGLTKGSIYGNFENKEEVALAVFDHSYAKMSKSITKHIQQADTYYDKLMVYAKFYHNLMRRETMPGGCPILNTAIEADDTNPQLKDRAAKAVSKWRNGIENLIQAGIASCEFRSDIDYATTALSIIALIEGGVMIAKVTDTPANLDMVLTTVEFLIRKLQV